MTLVEQMEANYAAALVEGYRRGLPPSLAEAFAQAYANESALDYDEDLGG